MRSITPIPRTVALRKFSCEKTGWDPPESFASLSWVNARALKISQPKPSRFMPETPDMSQVILRRYRSEVALYDRLIGRLENERRLAEQRLRLLESRYGERRA